MWYKSTGNFGPEIGKGKTKKISPERGRPFRTANWPAPLLAGHFNW